MMHNLLSTWYGVDKRGHFNLHFKFQFVSISLSWFDSDCKDYNLHHYFYSHSSLTLIIMPYLISPFNFVLSGIGCENWNIITFLDDESSKGVFILLEVSTLKSNMTNRCSVKFLCIK